MQKRERILAATVALLCGGWLIDSMVVQPSLAWYATVERETRDARREAGEAKAIIDRQAVIMAAWRAQHAAGLLANADQARFQLQSALASEAGHSGFTIDSVSGGQVIPATDDHIYDILRLGVSGRGTLAQVSEIIARLESSALPLAIERSEWSSSDPKRDFLDITLTVSTRMAGEQARAGRGIPENTDSWKPGVRERSLDAATLAAKPFLADRSPPRPPTVTKVEPEKPPPPPPTDPGWGLVGIATTDGQSYAFVRHLGDGTERQLTLGETIDGRTIIAIEKNGLRVTHNEDEQSIAVGNTIRGEAMKALVSTAVAPITPTKSSSNSSSSSRRFGFSRSSNENNTNTNTNTNTNQDEKPDENKPPATPFKVPAPTSDPAREAILERLRQQRARSN